MERDPSWCYTCKKEIVPTEDYSCPTCLGGWVGPLEDTEQQNYAVPEAQPIPQTPPPTPQPQVFQFNFGQPGVNPFAQLFNFGPQAAGVPPQQGNNQQQPGQFFAWGAPQNPQDPNQPGQPPMPQFFQWGGPHPAQQGQPGAPQPGVHFQAGPGVNVRRVVLNMDGGGNIHEILNQAFQQIGIPFPVGGNPFQVGNDFPVAGGGNFQDILNQLFQQHNPQGAPPASKEAVNGLKKIKIEKHHVDDKTDCTVCVGYYEEGEDVVELPCGHLFHEPCITPWLNMSNTCPVCRHELPTDDAAYEEAKRNKQEQQSNLRSSQSNNQQQNQPSNGSPQNPPSSEPANSTQTQPSNDTQPDLDDDLADID